MLKRFLIIFCLLFCKLSFAQEAPPLPPYFQEELEKVEDKGDSRFYNEFLNMLFYLVLLVALLFAGLWFFKRMAHTHSTRQNLTNAIQILEQRQLSNHSTLYLVEVEDQTHLIGESVNGLTALGKVAINPEITDK